MRLKSVILIGVGTCGVAGILWFFSVPSPPFASDDRRFDGSGSVAKGRIVFAAGDCASCHSTPGQSDRLKLGGGMALASPFGTFRPPNISPDPVDGIGAWSAVDLANALIGAFRRGTRITIQPFPILVLIA